MLHLLLPMVTYSNAQNLLDINLLTQTLIKSCVITTIILWLPLWLPTSIKIVASQIMQTIETIYMIISRQ